MTRACLAVNAGAPAPGCSAHIGLTASLRECFSSDKMRSSSLTLRSMPAGFAFARLLPAAVVALFFASAIRVNADEARRITILYDAFGPQTALLLA